MTYNFGDSFDLYTAALDPLSYWDAVAGSHAFGAGRFANSRALTLSNTTNLVKSSGANDPVHHIAFSFNQTVAMSAAGAGNVGLAFELFDGTSAQCSFGFRTDGAIVVYSGAPGGAVLAIFANAFTVANTWYGFEIEIVVNNTAGSIAVRRNGNPVNDFAATGLNTRGGTANNYANKLALLEYQGVGNHLADDFYWQSSAAAGTWLGELRCYTRMPVAPDVQAQFAKSQATVSFQYNTTLGGSYAMSANYIIALGLVATVSGAVTGLLFNFASAVTGNVSMAVYDATGVNGQPGNLLFSSAQITNPPAGLNTFSVSGTHLIQRGTTYFIALWSSAAFNGISSGLCYSGALALTYTGTFPATMPAFVASYYNQGTNSLGMVVTVANAGLVADPQQDGFATYVYDGNPGDQDFYNVAAIPSAAAYSTVATITRGLMTKSDVGARTAAVTLKSGATTVATSTIALTTSGWTWTWRLDLVDPNTSAAWTAAAVSAAQIGPTVVA